MGGHAFPHLFTPRISLPLYQVIREESITRLRELYLQVIVPAEAPEKQDFGDIDFLVAEPIGGDWPTVEMIKRQFGTKYGRYSRQLNVDTMYFATKAPGRDFWIQIDVAVCPKTSPFDWAMFRLAYASITKNIGSMISPLGLTFDPEGLHIRIEDMERVDWKGSLVFLTNNAMEMLELLGLDAEVYRNIKAEEQLFNWIASSWLFSSRHFAEQIKDAEYCDRLKKTPLSFRFVNTWIPSKFPCHESTGSQECDDKVNKSSHSSAAIRKAVVERALNLFPHARKIFETKRSTYLRGIAEASLRERIKSAIPLRSMPHKNSSQNPTSRDAAFKCVCRWTSFPPPTISPDGTPTVTLSIPVTPQPKGMEKRMMFIDCGVSEEALITWTKEQWEKLWENQRQRNIEKRIGLREAKKMKEVTTGHIDKGVLVAG